MNKPKQGFNPKSLNKIIIPERKIDNAIIDKLYVFFQEGDLQKIKDYIVSNNLTTAILNSNGENILHAIISNVSLNNYTKIELVKFIKASSTLMETFDVNHMTPLHLAVINQLEDIVKILINAGHQINATDALYKTPLHYAVIGNTIPCIDSRQIFKKEDLPKPSEHINSLINQLSDKLVEYMNNDDIIKMYIEHIVNTFNSYDDIFTTNLKLSIKENYENVIKIVSDQNINEQIKQKHIFNYITNAKKKGIDFITSKLTKSLKPMDISPNKSHGWGIDDYQFNRILPYERLAEFDEEQKLKQLTQQIKVVVHQLNTEFIIIKNDLTINLNKLHNDFSQQTNYNNLIDKQTIIDNLFINADIILNISDVNYDDLNIKNSNFYSKTFIILFSFIDNFKIIIDENINYILLYFTKKDINRDYNIKIIYEENIINIIINIINIVNCLYIYHKKINEISSNIPNYKELLTKINNLYENMIKYIDLINNIITYINHYSANRYNKIYFNNLSYKFFDKHETNILKDIFNKNIDLINLPTKFENYIKIFNVYAINKIYELYVPKITCINYLYYYDNVTDQQNAQIGYLINNNIDFFSNEKKCKNGSIIDYEPKTRGYIGLIPIETNNKSYKTLPIINNLLDEHIEIIKYIIIRSIISKIHSLFDGGLSLQKEKDKEEAIIKASKDIIEQTKQANKEASERQRLAIIAQAPVAQAPVAPVAQTPVAQAPVIAQAPVVPIVQAPVVPIVQAPVIQQTFNNANIIVYYTDNTYLGYIINDNYYLKNNTTIYGKISDTFVCDNKIYHKIIQETTNAILFYITRIQNQHFRYIKSSTLNMQQCFQINNIDIMQHFPQQNNIQLLTNIQQFNPIANILNANLIVTDRIINNPNLTINLIITDINNNYIGHIENNKFMNNTNEIGDYDNLPFIINDQQYFIISQNNTVIGFIIMINSYYIFINNTDNLFTNINNAIKQYIAPNSSHFIFIDDNMIAYIINNKLFNINTYKYEGNLNTTNISTNNDIIKYNLIDLNNNIIGTISKQIIDTGNSYIYENDNVQLGGNDNVQSGGTIADDLKIIISKIKEESKSIPEDYGIVYSIVGKQIDDILITNITRIISTASSLIYNKYDSNIPELNDYIKQIQKNASNIKLELLNNKINDDLVLYFNNNINFAFEEDLFMKKQKNNNIKKDINRCYEYNSDIINLLIDNHANINAPDRDGYTPIHDAIIALNINAIQKLIANNASVSKLKSRFGYSPFEQFVNLFKAELDILKQTKLSELTNKLNDEIYEKTKQHNLKHSNIILPMAIYLLNNEFYYQSSNYPKNWTYNQQKQLFKLLEINITNIPLLINYANTMQKTILKDETTKINNKISDVNNKINNIVQSVASLDQELKEFDKSTNVQRYNIINIKKNKYEDNLKLLQNDLLKLENLNKINNDNINNIIESKFDINKIISINNTSLDIYENISNLYNINNIDIDKYRIYPKLWSKLLENHNNDHSQLIENIINKTENNLLNKEFSLLCSDLFINVITPFIENYQTLPLLYKYINQPLDCIINIIIHVTKHIICPNIYYTIIKLLSKLFENNKYDLIDNLQKSTILQKYIFDTLPIKLTKIYLDIAEYSDDLNTKLTSKEIFEEITIILNTNNVVPIDNNIKKILEDIIYPYFETYTEIYIKNMKKIIDDYLKQIETYSNYINILAELNTNS